jgi:hypothetical protein
VPLTAEPFTQVTQLRLQAQQCAADKDDFADGEGGYGADKTAQQRRSLPERLRADRDTYGYQHNSKDRMHGLARSPVLVRRSLSG